MTILPQIPAPTLEGSLQVPGGRISYCIFGTGAAAPLVVIHGGPGFPMDYLLPLARLATVRPVIFYDQLGCGRSQRPNDLSLWVVNRFVFELQALVRELNLPRPHFLGHSWGSIVALEYALAVPEQVSSLILASPCLSIPRWREDASRLRRSLPWKAQWRLRTGERLGDFTSDSYRAAMKQYYERFVYGRDIDLELIKRSEAGAGAAVYQTMWGPNEFVVQGTLRNYDRSSALSRLSTPVLYTCGSKDEATPETTKFFAELTPGADLAEFKKSAHMPHISEAEEYLRVVSKFLEK